MKGNKLEDFIMSDFTQLLDDDDLAVYELNNNINIFGNQFEHPLEIIIYKDNRLSENIAKINNYIKWFAGDFKKDLINYYNNRENKVNDIWYEELEIHIISISVEKDGKLSSYMSGRDSIYETDELYIFQIRTEEEKIIEIMYIGFSSYYRI